MSDRLNLEAFIATDRLQAMAQGQVLPAVMRGTLVMADLTGYTGAVEQAMRQLGATRGADLMTQVINHIFDRLIREIYQHGGVVVGFAGDALLAWYAGDEGVQATASAFAMQQSIAQAVDLLPVSTAKFVFVLKASIASGSVQRCVVGDPKIQQFDLLTGEAMNKLALVQQMTKGSSVMLDEACALHLAGQIQIQEWVVDPTSQKRFARVAWLNCSLPKVDLPIIPSLEQQRLTPWILRPVCETLLATKGKFTASIRQVVALFFKFHLPEAILSEDCSKEIDHYVRWVQGTLHKQNGYVIKLTIDDKGCYGLATFGAPQDAEDAPQRALTAALALRNPPSQLAFVDAIQIGISQGRMLAGNFGNSLRAGYDLLGHELTIANRLMTRAKAGEILVTAPVVENSQRFFKFQHLGSEMVKGSQQPVDLFSLLGAQNEIAFDSGKNTLGRDEELAHLHQLCQSLPTRGLQTVRLVGAPGIGKTQLVLELYRRALQWGVHTLLADCERVTQRVAYYPWQQMLEQWVRMRCDKPPAEISFEQIETHFFTQLEDRFERSIIHTVLSDIWGRNDEDDHLHGKAQERHATIATVLAALLRDQLASQPLLITIEDVQWLDLPSFELLLNLKRSLAELPLLLLVTHRPVADSRDQQRFAAALQQLPDSIEMEIKAFEPSATEELIVTQLGGKVAPLLHSLLYAQTQGNPLAIEEAIRTHQITGRIRLDESQSHWTLSPQALNELRQAHCLEINPATGEWQLTANASLAQAGFGTPDQLQQMIFARFDLLNADLQLTLKVASVIGRSFDLPLLQAAHPLKPNRSALRDQLSKLSQHHFLTSQPAQSSTLYRFQHQLIQEGIYESMPLAQQTALHYAVGNGLATEKDGSLEQVAWHFWRCRAEYPELALHYVKLAAKQAQNYANHAALDFYNQALELTGQDAELLKGKVEVLHVLGRYDEEKIVLEQLSRLAYHYDNGVNEKLVNEGEVHYLWGNYYVEREDYAAANVAFQRVCQLAEAYDDPIRQAQGLARLGWVARTQNQLDQAQLYYEEAIVYFNKMDADDFNTIQVQCDALNGLGTVFLQNRNYTQTGKYYRKALELSRSVQHRRQEARALSNLGVLGLYQRQLDDAKTVLEQSLGIRRSIGDRLGEGECLTNLTAVCAELGEFEDAIHFNKNAQVIHLALNNSEGLINGLISLGIIYRELAMLNEAKATLEKGLALAKAINDQLSCDYVRSNLGLVWRDLGKLKQARKCLLSGLQSAQARSDHFHAAVFLSYLATVSLQAGDFDLAEAEALEAIRIRSTPELLPLTSDDRANLASVYLQTNRHSAALCEADLVRQQLTAPEHHRAEFPQRNWYICYTVFQAALQPQAAHFAAEKAYEIVMSRAARLRDTAFRQRYLHDIQLHRSIVVALESASTVANSA